jgi:uncharacterized membrane protein YfcA
MSLYMPIAGIPLDLIVLIALGVSVGVLSGMFGVGGGFITTPALIFLGVPGLVAVGTGALQVIASSVSGALRHWRLGNVDIALGRLLILGGLVGAVSGVQLQQQLKSLGQLDLFISLNYVLVLGAIGILMTAEGISSWRKTRKDGPPPGRRAGQHSLLQRLPLKMRFRQSKLYASMIPPVATGMLVGWLTAIMGVGGGFLLVPALIYVIRVPTRIAIGTSAFQIIFVSAFNTVLQSVQNNNVDVLLGLPIILGGVVGAQIGVAIAARTRAEELRILMGLLVLSIAGRVAFDLLRAPADRFSIETLPELFPSQD